MCHERTIDVGLAELAIAGLDRATLEPVLIYCAELRCEADAATCPGCKRRTEALGIHSLDDFIARHREIVVGDGSVRLLGQGEGTLHTPALAALEKTWAGEKYWFWARRVLRKLRHGIRRAGLHGTAFAGEGETPAVIADGAAARRQHRHGGARHGQLRPRRLAPHRPARRLAEREGAHRRFGRQLHHRRRGGLPDARCGDRRLQLAGRHHRAPARPAQARADAGSRPWRRCAARIDRGERCGILFGRERNGLETEEVANADALS